MRRSSVSLRKRRATPGSRRRSGTYTSIGSTVWALLCGIQSMIGGVRSAARGWRKVLRHVRALGSRPWRWILILTMVCSSLGLGTIHAEAPANAVLLAPSIPLGEPAATARGTFFEAQFTLDLPERVRIAATADGTGTLCTDDAAEITFEPDQGEPQVWRQLFATPDRHTITCLPAQTVVLTNGPGVYRVGIRLYDVYADRYSSTAYYLVRLPVADPQSTDAGIITLPPSVTPQPSATPTPMVTTSPTLAVPGAPPVTTPQVPLPERAWFNSRTLVLIGILGSLGLVLLSIVLLRRRRPVLPHGIIDLYDRTTGESRTLLLYRFPHGAGIIREPLDLVAPPHLATTPLGLITPTRSGLVLEQRNPDTTVQRTPLQVGEALLLNQTVEVRLRLG